jgi:hypothetical protein
MRYPAAEKLEIIRLIEQSPLPPHRAGNFVDRCTLGALQHRDDRVLL